MIADAVKKIVDHVIVILVLAATWFGGIGIDELVRAQFAEHSLLGYGLGLLACFVAFIVLWFWWSFVATGFRRIYELTLEKTK